MLLKYLCSSLSKSWWECKDVCITAKESCFIPSFPCFSLCFAWFEAFVWLWGHPHLSTELNFTRNPTRQGHKGLSMWVLKTTEKRQHDNSSVSHTRCYPSEFQPLYPGNRLQQPLTQTHLWEMSKSVFRKVHCSVHSEQLICPNSPRPLLGPAHPDLCTCTTGPSVPR